MVLRPASDMDEAGQHVSHGMYALVPASEHRAWRARRLAGRQSRAPVSRPAKARVRQLDVSQDMLCWQGRARAVWAQILAKGGRGVDIRFHGG